MDRKHGCVLRWLMDRPHLVQTLHCKASDYDRVLWKYKVQNSKMWKWKKIQKPKYKKLVATTELLLCKYKIQNIDHSQQCTWNSGDPKCSFPAFYKRFDAPKRVAMLWKPERTKHLPMDVGLVSKNILYGIIFVLHILVHVGWREATHLQMSKWGEDWSPASLPNMSHLRPLHIDNHGGPCWCWEPGPSPDELPGQLHRDAKSVRISMTVLSELRK